MAHGEINHIEFPADDPERAMALLHGGRRLGVLGDGRDARLLGLPHRRGLRRRGRQARRHRPARSSATTSTVDSIEDALAAAERTGGTIKEPKTEIPGMGWFAVVTDPEGNEVGLYQSSRARLRPAAHRRQMRRCASSTATATSRPTASTTTSTRSSGRARLAGRRADPRPGLERLVVGRARSPSSERLPWLDAAVGVHPHDAAAVDDDGVGGDRGLGRATRASSRSARPASTTTGSSRRSSPSSSNLRRNLAPRRRDRQAGDPPLPLADGRARRPGRARSRELRAFGARRRRAVVIHSFSGPLDYAEAMLELGAAISISGLAFRAGEEATADVVRLVPADRLLVETDSPFLAAARRPARPNEPEWVRVTPPGSPSSAAIDPDALGDALVATYDRTFAAPRPGLTAAQGPPAATVLALSHREC